MTKELWIGLFIILAIFSFETVTFTTASAPPEGKLNLKEGDEIYACVCGGGCKCDTLSHNAGNCTCGVEMAKGKVTRVEGEYVLVKTSKQETPYKTTGKYACPSCGAISQEPGLCSCGQKMVMTEVKKQ
jgi:hypothetical protein